MKQEVVGRTNTATLRLERALKRYVLILPLFTSLYGYFLSRGWVNGSPFYTNTACIILIICLSLVVLAHALTPTLTTASRAAYLSLYHLLLAFGLIYVFGVLNPLIIAWMLL